MASELVHDLSNKVERDAIRSLSSAFELLDIVGEPPESSITLAAAVGMALIGRAMSLTYCICGGDTEAYAGAVEALTKDFKNALSIENVREFSDLIGATPLVEKIREHQRQAAAEPPEAA